MRTLQVPGAAGRLLAACWIIVNGGCGNPRDSAAARTLPAALVVVETVERRDVPIVEEMAARTEPTATVEIRANVEGRLTDMFFKEGHLIQKGQLLFRIDPRHYDAAVKAAEAAVEKAEADLQMAREQQHLVNAQSAVRQAEANLLKSTQDVERLKPLAARKAVPARDLDTAIAAQSSAVAVVEDARATARTTTVGDRMGLKQAQAGVTMAKLALEEAALNRAETEIRAPIGGLIGREEVSVGNYVGRGGSSRLAIISNVDPINVVFGISETLYLLTESTVESAALEHIELILADSTLYPFQGRFTNMAGAVDEKTGTLLAIAQFRNPKALLLPGMTGRVRLAVGTRQGAVLIPERALFDVQGSKAVYLVTPDNKVALRSIVTAGTYQGRRIVTTGLSGGETVIVPGDSKLRPGQPVTPQVAQPGRGQNP
jgi:membrane fusion protein (multidrug efflux system)